MASYGEILERLIDGYDALNPPQQRQIRQIIIDVDNTGCNVEGVAEYRQLSMELAELREQFIAGACDRDVSKAIVTTGLNYIFDEILSAEGNLIPDESAKEDRETNTVLDTAFGRAPGSQTEYRFVELIEVLVYDIIYLLNELEEEKDGELANEPASYSSQDITAMLDQRLSDAVKLFPDIVLNKETFLQSVIATGYLNESGIDALYGGKDSNLKMGIDHRHRREIQRGRRGEA